MRALSNKLQMIASVLLFVVIMTCCYLFIDDHLAFCTQDIRESFYVPLRIVSILTSPALHLLVWTSLFLWALLLKKARNLSTALYPMLASLILTNALVRVVKVILGRSRPDIFLTNGIYHLKLISFQRVFSSLPSGHAATIAVIMGFLAARYPRYSLFYICLSVITSLCRVFIGAHYLSDVLVGNFLGFYISWILYYHFQVENPSYLDYTKEDILWKKRRIPSSS